jgi:hypothetical protein
MYTTNKTSFPHIWNYLANIQNQYKKNSIHMNHELISVHFSLQNISQDKHYHILGYVILLMPCRPHTFIWCICESFNQVLNHHVVKMSLFYHPPIKANTNVQFWIISYSTSMYFCLNKFKAYITNLACNELIMKIMQSSSIHKFIHLTHEYHALKTHLTHG